MERMNQAKHSTHQGLSPAGVELTQRMMVVCLSHFPATVTNMHLLGGEHVIRGTSQSPLNLVRKSHASAVAEKTSEEQEWDLRGAKSSILVISVCPAEVETD